MEQVFNSKKILPRKWRQDEIQRHYRRVIQARPMVDSFNHFNVPHLAVKSKREQIREDRATEIEKANMHLFNKMRAIIHSSQRDRTPARRSGQMAPRDISEEAGHLTRSIESARSRNSRRSSRSASNSARGRTRFEERKLQKDNKAQYNRLIDVPRTYDVVKWRKEEEQRQRLLRNMRQSSPSPSSIIEVPRHKKHRQRSRSKPLIIDPQATPLSLLSTQRIPRPQKPLYNPQQPQSNLTPLNQRRLQTSIINSIQEKIPTRSNQKRKISVSRERNSGFQSVPRSRRETMIPRPFENLMSPSPNRSRLDSHSRTRQIQVIKSNTDMIKNQALMKSRPDQARGSRSTGVAHRRRLPNTYQTATVPVFVSRIPIPERVNKVDARGPHLQFEVSIALSPEVLLIRAYHLDTKDDFFEIKVEGQKEVKAVLNQFGYNYMFIARSLRIMGEVMVLLNPKRSNDVSAVVSVENSVPDHSQSNRTTEFADQEQQQRKSSGPIKIHDIE